MVLNHSFILIQVSTNGIQRLKLMHNHDIVTGLPKFRVGIRNVCEARQLGKQSKSAFSHDKHVRKNILDVVHSDVWGQAKTTSNSAPKKMFNEP